MAFGRKGDARACRALSNLRAGDRVVDIGCGPGVAVRYAARLGATATGVDPAAVMLRVARLLTRSAKCGTSGAPLRQSRFRSYRFGRVVDRNRAPLVGHRRRATRSPSCAPPGGISSPSSDGQPRARGHGSHGWTNEQAIAFAIDAANTASPTFASNGRPSGADQRSVW